MFTSTIFLMFKTARNVIQRYSRSFCLSALIAITPSVVFSQTIYIDEHAVSVQLALTEAQQQRGLQGVSSLASNEGMLFVFKPARPICMWMKDVPIDLDVGFFDEKGLLMSVHQMKAQTENTHCSQRPAAWALEMKGGWFKENKIRKEAKLNLGNGPQHPEAQP